MSDAPLHRGVLEVLGAQSGDQFAVVRSPGEPGAQAGGQRGATERQPHGVALNTAGTRFMLGEPMKPATNRLTGSS